MILLSSFLICSSLGCHGQIDYVRARVTYYDRASSCHNMNSKGECLTASGVPVSVGQVACPRSVPLGSRVSIGGVMYTCTDRYAKWLDVKYPDSPTFDIFVDECVNKSCSLSFQPVTVWTNPSFAR